MTDFERILSLSDEFDQEKLIPLTIGQLILLQSILMMACTQVYAQRESSRNTLLVVNVEERNFLDRQLEEMNRKLALVIKEIDSRLSASSSAPTGHG